MFSLEWGVSYENEANAQAYSGGGCLACLLCFIGSIPAFAAETATPANADGITEILPDLESEAPGMQESGTLETPEEVSPVLVTEIHKEAKIRWYLLR